ncbi:hypothetical protein N4G69_31270 [Streptomyces mirabilis]|uniref:hypothetical protein n=1 Tax=Streptomyces mirabilis TaxID=68239 RepID=UPI0021C19A41|nr:hypothetical protein [Streptomyces mirabilis]MCT9110024.1 hypothetical protein [Streptomyces mirabilis]
MTKRVSMALASTALAGGALLGAGGSASAATTSVPVQHTQYVSATSATSATSSEQAGRHTDDDHRGQDTVRYVRTADHEGEAASWRGVSAARWYQDQVDEAASWHSVSAARWYEDQVMWSLNHS